MCTKTHPSLTRALKALILIIALGAISVSACPANAGQATLASLSESEREWLAGHQEMKLGVGIAFPPFQYVQEENGKRVFKGMVADYITLLEKRLGITLTPVTDITFPEAMERGKTGDIDFFPCIAWTPEREAFLSFTMPYLDYPLVIVIRDDMDPVFSVEDMEGLRIAVIKPLATYSKLVNDYPDISFDFVFRDTAPEILSAVSSGQADACIINLAVASHEIRNNGLTNLRVSAPTPWETNKLRMAVPSGRTVLLSIINKALASISEEEHDVIRRTWLSLELSQPVNWDRVMFIGLPSLGVILLVLVLVLAWNRSLARENERRIKAEERFRLAAECASDLVYEYDLKTGALRWFGDVEQALGLMPGKAPQTILEALRRVHPDDAKIFKSLREDIFNSRLHDLDLEFRIRHAGGHWLTWTLRARTVFDKTGHPVRQVGACTDITARRKALSELSMREAEYRGIFESVTDNLFIIAPGGDIVEVNPAACAHYGYSKEELLSIKVVDLIPETYHEEAREFVQTIAREGHHQIESVNVRKDGSVFPTLVTGATIEFRGRPHNLALVRDISAQKEAEAATRDSEAKLAGIVGSITDAMWMADEHCNLVWANDVTRQLFGTGITSRKYGDVFSGSEAPTRQCDAMMSFKDGKPHEFETTLTCQDGLDRIFWCTTSVATRYEDDRPRTVVGVLRDVTERKRVEEIMVQTEKMVSLGNLAAGMAHEINNPLGIILSSVQNARRRISPEMEANLEVARRHEVDLDRMAGYLTERGVSNYLKMIQNAGVRAGRIVSNMLAFSRKSQSDRTEQDIALLLEKALELAANNYDLRKRYDLKEVEIIRNYDTRLPKIRVNETEMEQVFLNLIINAVQAMYMAGDESGRTLTLTTAQADSGVNVTIRDTGPGMDENTRKHIFEPFFTTKEMGKGTGLGLSVSYFIVVKNHGGTIHLDSQPGKGAAFKIFLPFH